MHDLLRAYAAEQVGAQSETVRRAAVTRLLEYYTAAAAMDVLTEVRDQLRQRVFQPLPVRERLIDSPQIRVHRIDDPTLNSLVEDDVTGRPSAARPADPAPAMDPARAARNSRPAGARVFAPSAGQRPSPSS